jgi:disulfide bond formation protein DsbB
MFLQKAKQLFLSSYWIIIFLISGAAMFGSLYYSEILKLEPCPLCWYQRIFMYPIAIFTAAALVFKIQIRKIYILILSIPGLLFAVYHVYVQASGSESLIGNCGGTAVSCNTIDVMYFGFLTIPVMSLLSFITITVVLLIASYLEKRK